ncbi:non-ribosomal peptide synthetase [Xenorhabdus bovienii]|uniref:Amino acid adenylation domain-containing protein n=1 Tax=Xenorhabdus bovienii str. Intermedium TaxID=1379677 RepID=A0A077QE42_XENBV|nr:non-ribosomal peptide synthetase [Xenorhabdus bovienii]CDH31403.1 Amino acid adenylation domain-containing protein [Xenorhabdus bovienii str. Intermedium]
MANIKHTELKSLKLDELKRLVRQKKIKDNSIPKETIKKNTDPDRKYFPVTSAQKNIWMLNQYLDDKKVYSIPLAITCQLKYEIDLRLVKQALMYLAHKHDILRTTFHLTGKEICQYVSDDAVFDFRYDDITYLPERDKKRQVEAMAKAEGNRCFDLTGGPLAYLYIVKTNSHEYVFLLSFHHIIADGWTVGLFLKEFIETYLSLLSGEITRKVEENLQFSDYALAEDQWHAEGKYQQGLEYWAKKLGNVQGILDIATDRPRPSKMNTAGSIMSLFFDGDFCQRLQTCAVQYNATQFHVILAAYEILLHKYSGQQEISIGIPFANRNQSVTQNIMGLFMNTLPLCFRIDPEITLSALVQITAKECEQSMAYQDIPFNHILDKIAYVRNPQVNPIFQAILTYQIFPHYQATSLFKYQPLKIDYGVAKLDLNLWVEKERDGLLFTMNYSTALFNGDTIQRMLADLRTILDAFIGQPKLAVRELSLLSHTERTNILAGCHSIPDISPAAVHRQFEQQACLIPNAIAVRCAGRTLSYKQLNQQANRLAHYLLEKGLSCGERVALLMAKSEDCVVALLAVLKAGGCYVPVDINLPQQQVDFILTNASVRYVLVESEERVTHVPCINVNQKFNNLPESNPQLEQPIDDLPAYIIYTSGSSGKPKGVKVNHSHLSHYCQAVTPVLDQKPGARYGMFSSFTTDLAHTMLFPALINQGQLEVIHSQHLSNPQKLFDYLATSPLDCMKVTPTHLAALLGTPESSKLIPKNLLVLGGEKVPVSLIQHIREFNGNCRIVNHYGPTECTVGVTTYNVPAELDRLENDYLPIGVPLKDSHVLVLDASQKLVPAKLPGEIYIGGAHLAAGYIDGTEKNRDGFIPHPYLAGQRLYRSGDKGRLLPDGNLEFLGRIDRQVKVRGYRVELTAIEDVLRQLPEVTNAAVIQCQLPTGATSLVAYLCGVGERYQATVQSELQKKLPHYMQPEQWVWLESLPLTSGGKINYTALPRLRPDTRQCTQEPKSETEHRLHDIYCAVLECNQVDTQKSFFSLGGNSINALQLIIEVNHQLGSFLSLGQLFENSSISQLATLLEQTVSPMASSLVMFNYGLPDNKPTLLMIHPAGGNILCYHPLVREMGADYPAYGLQVANFGQDAPHNHDIKSLAEFYLTQSGSLIQRTRLVLGGWSLGATIAFEMAQQLAQKTGVAPTVLVLDQPAPQVDIDNSVQMNKDERLVRFVRKVELFLGTSLNISCSVLTEMSEAQRSELFLTEFKRVHLVPDNISNREFQYFLVILRAHIHATDQYQGKIYPGKILVVEAEETLPGRTKLGEPGLGWQPLSYDRLKIINAMGNHVSMMQEPYITHIANQLREVLP